MLIRQFVFKHRKDDLLDKDLYADVVKGAQYTCVTLKENTKIGYAHSFQEAIDYVHDMSSLFIPDSITEVNLFNGLVLLRGKGQSTPETIMDLTCSYFNYCLPDVNMVTIEMKGILKPVVQNKGQFIGYFKEECIIEEDSMTVELFSSLKGTPIVPISTENGLSSYQSNMLTSILLKKIEDDLFLQLRYLGVNPDTGELYKNIFFTKEHYDGSIPNIYQHYDKCIQKAYEFLNR